MSNNSLKLKNNNKETQKDSSESSEENNEDTHFNEEIRKKERENNTLSDKKTKILSDDELLERSEPDLSFLSSKKEEDDYSQRIESQRLRLEFSKNNIVAQIDSKKQNKNKKKLKTHRRKNVSTWNLEDKKENWLKSLHKYHLENHSKIFNDYFDNHTHVKVVDFDRKVVHFNDIHRKAISRIFITKKIIFCSSLDSKISLINLKRRTISTVSCHSKGVTDICVIKNHIFTISYDQTLKIYDLKSQKFVKKFRLDFIPYCLHVERSQDEKLKDTYFISSENSLRIFGHEFELIKQIPVEFIFKLRVNKNLLAFLDLEQKLTILDKRTFQMIFEYENVADFHLLENSITFTDNEKIISQNLENQEQTEFKIQNVTRIVGESSPHIFFMTSEFELFTFIGEKPNKITSLDQNTTNITIGSNLLVVSDNTGGISIKKLTDFDSAFF